MKKFDYSTYLSPFTWRYGSEQMRQIWSEENKRKLWRKVWVALAKAQKDLGLVSKKELDDLIKYKDQIDIKRAQKIEENVYHDLMAEVKTYAEQAKIGGGKIHLGATSTDIEDNVDALRIKESLEIIERKIKELLKIFAQKITKYKDLLCMGYTHLQPAEPTTLGYRLAFYGQDLILDYQLLQFVKSQIKGKGMKGAVGTSASYIELVGDEGAEEIEKAVMKELGLLAVTIANQTVTRKIESLVGSLLSSLAQTLYKFAFDVRIMQSPGFSEWQEYTGSKDIGSSAMPFKKNPQRSEQICSLARLVMQLAKILEENAANMLLERTLDDSANRRVVLPEIFLATEQIVDVGTKVLQGLIVNKENIKANLEKFASFAATEAILMEASKKGADRQKLYQSLREICMSAWNQMTEGKENPMERMLLENKDLKKYLKEDEIKKLLNVKSHIGNALEKALTLVREIKKIS